MNSYKDTIKELFALQSLGIRPGLKSTLDHLSRLKNPHKEYPTIHIAGTNGKGSTGAAIEAILTAAGYSSGLYTSPHLLKFNERIRISKSPISDRAVVDITARIKEACSSAGAQPTFFEFATLMAFEYFKKKSVDIAVIETGLGGRLDATNVIDPLVTIITNIARDHTALLGTRIEDIAAEKAGIVKDVPCITAVTSERALRAIRSKCREKGARLYIYGKDFFTSPSTRVRGGFDYHGIKRSIKGLKINLRGSHQITNSACALAALETIADRGFEASVRAVRGGLKSVEWQGRMEVIKRRPLVLLDSAHNKEAARVLAGELKRLEYTRLFMIIGIMEDKEVKDILGHLGAAADTIILTRPSYHRAADTASLFNAIDKKTFTGEVIMTKSVKEACDRAIGLATKGDAIVITGSIFTLGEAKAWLTEKGRSL